jgi:hypothetical protein
MDLYRNRQKAATIKLVSIRRNININLIYVNSTITSISPNKLRKGGAEKLIIKNKNHQMAI